MQTINLINQLMIALLDMPANIDNWLVFISGYTHCTVYEVKCLCWSPILVVSSNDRVLNQRQTWSMQMTLRREFWQVCWWYVLQHLGHQRGSQSTEQDNIETRARTNNLMLNRTNSKEIFFIDPKRKHQDADYPPLPAIVRVTSLKVLSVTVTNSLSATDMFVAPLPTALNLSTSWGSCTPTAWLISSLSILGTNSLFVLMCR